MGSSNLALLAILGVASKHGNSNSSVKNQVLYEFRIDGETYKFGIGDASDVLTRDVHVTAPDGTVKTIPEGTPRRIYAQERKMLRKYQNVQVFYTEHKQVSRLTMKSLETTAVGEHLKRTGYIPDGNSAHLRKFPSSTSKGKFPKVIR